MRHLVAALSVIVSAGLLASATLDTCALAAPGKSKDPAAQADRELAKLVKQLTKKAQRESRARSKAFSKRVRSIVRAIETGKGLDELLAEAGVEGSGASAARKGADPSAVTTMVVRFAGVEVVDAYTEAQLEYAYGRRKVRTQQAASSRQTDYGREYEYADRNRDAFRAESRGIRSGSALLGKKLFEYKNDRDEKGGRVTFQTADFAEIIGDGLFTGFKLVFVAAEGDGGVNVKVLPPSPESSNQTASVKLGDERGVELASEAAVPAQTPKGNSYFSAYFTAEQIKTGRQYMVWLSINDGDREWCESQTCFYVAPDAPDADPADPPAREWPEKYFSRFTLGDIDHPVSPPVVAQIGASGDRLHDAYLQFPAGDEDSFGVVVMNLSGLTQSPAEIHSADGKWFVCLDQDSGLSLDFYKFDPNGGQALDAGFPVGDYTVKLYFADDPGKPHPSGFTTDLHMIVEGTLAQMDGSGGSPHKFEMFGKIRFDSRDL